MKKIIPQFLLLCVLSSFTNAQEGKYSFRSFAKNDKGLKIKLQKSKNGPLRTYVVSKVTVWDIDKDSTEHVKGDTEALVLIEGNQKDNKRHGVFTFYLVDDLNHSSRYKLYEQTYANDKLNGEWRVYNLGGTLISVENYKNDSLTGVSKWYWIDGKRILRETNYSGKSGTYNLKEFHANGRLASQTDFVDFEPNGISKKFYETGQLKDSVYLLHGQPNGIRSYYYPDGKTWIVQSYKNGLPWAIISNYDSKGNKRNAGTLKDGNGTVILYDDDVKVREVITYKNGVESNQ